MGQAPLGIGILLCSPICKKFGKRNALLGGMVVATLGVILCLANPRNMVIVLTGQVIRTVGFIESFSSMPWKIKISCRPQEAIVVCRI